MSRSVRSCLCAAGLAISMATLVWAEPPATAPVPPPAPAPAPAAAPATAQPPAQAPAKTDSKISAEAQVIVDRALAAYRGMKSYRDTAVAKQVLVAKDKDGKAVDPGEMQEVKFAAASGGKFRVETEQETLVSDGTMLTTAMPMLGQYTQKPLKEAMAEPMTGEQMLMSHPLLRSFLTPGKAWGEVYPMVSSLTTVTAEALNNKPGKRVAGMLDMGAMGGQPGGEGQPFSMWFSDATGLLGEVRLDMTSMYKQMIAQFKEVEGIQGGEKFDPSEVLGFDPKTFERNELVMSLGEVVADEAIADAKFTYTPGKEEKKVAEFDATGPDEAAQQALVGEPAPAIAAKTVDGKDFSLESLKGKIVVMDFWATWCGPCVQAIPSVQKVSERFADKGVVVVGINQDGGSSAEKKVSTFLEKKGIRFTQVMDPKNQIGRAYRVSGIPTMVFVDAKGVITEIHVGGGPGIEEEVAAKIEKMLAKQSPK